MSLQEWTLIIGVITTIGLAMGQWMFKVHAKLAVIASKVVDVCEKLDHTAEQHRELWQLCARHQSRLDTHDVQLSHIAERLQRS